MSQHIERRRSQRCEIDFFVQEIVGERTYLHPAIDLSTDGIYILVHDDRKAIDGDQAVRLEFTLPSGKAIRASGAVRYVDDRRGQRGVGIEFTNMAAGDRAAIADFISRADVSYSSGGEEKVAIA